MKITFLTLLLAFLMTGCFNNEPPKCSDESVHVTLQDVYLQVLDNINDSGNPFLAGFSKNLPQNLMSLSSVRAVSYDEAVLLRSCKADALFDNGETVGINYTVQANEENSDEFYVELETEFLEGMMQKSMMQGIFNK